MMDDGEVLLQAGDVLIQRGTNHAWSNRTNEPPSSPSCLIDAEPVVASYRRPFNSGTSKSSQPGTSATS